MQAAAVKLRSSTMACRHSSKACSAGAFIDVGMEGGGGGGDPQDEGSRGTNLSSVLIEHLRAGKLGRRGRQPHSIHGLPSQCLPSSRGFEKPYRSKPGVLPVSHRRALHARLGPGVPCLCGPLPERPEQLTCHPALGHAHCPCLQQPRKLQQNFIVRHRSRNCLPASPMEPWRGDSLANLLTMPVCPLIGGRCQTAFNYL